MASVLLKFAISLENTDFLGFDQPHGALFHRWLPDGEKDAIIIELKEPSSILKMWFERLGYVNKDGYVKFDLEKKEIDLKAISTQAILQGGPLYGLLELREISEEEADCLKENKAGSGEYLTLGKTIVKLIWLQVNRFISALRTNYGQFWINAIEKWDSREGSLGHYCRSILNLKWSLDEGKTWQTFMPDEPTVVVTLIAQVGYEGYLAEEDWKDLSEIINEGFEPSLASFLLCRAQQLFEQGNVKYALIEGVTALEVALSEFFKKKLESSKPLLKGMSSFWETSLTSQTITAAILLEKISKENLEQAVKAIESRNKVIHEGMEIPTEIDQQIRGLLATAATLVSGPKFRFLNPRPGNSILPVEPRQKA